MKKRGIISNSMMIIYYIGNHTNCILIDVSKNLDLSYSQVVKTINTLSEAGYITLKKDGRIVKSCLSIKGFDLFYPICRIVEVEGVDYKNYKTLRVQDESQRNI